MKLLETLEEFHSLEIGTLCYIECSNKNFNKKQFVTTQKAVKEPNGSYVGDYYFFEDNKIKRMITSSIYGCTKIWVLE